MLQSDRSISKIKTKHFFGTIIACVMHQSLNFCNISFRSTLVRFIPFLGGFLVKNITCHSKLEERSFTRFTPLNFSDTTGRKDALNSFTIQKNEDQEEEQNGRTSSKHVGTHKYHRLDVFQLVLNSKCSYHQAESQQELKIKQHT